MWLLPRVMARLLSSLWVMHVVSVRWTEIRSGARYEEDAAARQDRPNSSLPITSQMNPVFACRMCGLITCRPSFTCHKICCYSSSIVLGSQNKLQEVAWAHSHYQTRNNATLERVFLTITVDIFTNLSFLSSSTWFCHWWRSCWSEIEGRRWRDSKIPRGGMVGLVVIHGMHFVGEVVLNSSKSFL